MKDEHGNTLFENLMLALSADYTEIGSNQSDTLLALENARLTASELQWHMLHNRGHDISRGYCTVALRRFREWVLSWFFRDYPQAAHLLDWHHVAEGVAIYTYSDIFDVCWMPGRAAVLDAVQKCKLLDGYQILQVSFDDGLLRWSENNLVRSKRIKPVTRNWEYYAYRWTIEPYKVWNWCDLTQGHADYMDSKWLDRKCDQLYQAQKAAQEAA